MTTIRSTPGGALLPALLFLLAPLATSGDFKVMESVDTITLTDGSNIEGIIVASGAKAIVIVVEGEAGPQEQVVPRDKIKEVKTGAPTAHTKAYTTDPVDGVKVVTGEGFRDTAGQPAGTSGQPATAQTPPRPQAPAARQKPSATPAGTPRAPKITAEMIQNMLGKSPQLKTLVNAIGGPEKAAQLVNDPRRRLELEEMARSLGVELPRTF